jgi:hypothetical protein
VNTTVSLPNTPRYRSFQSRHSPGSRARGRHTAERHHRGQRRLLGLRRMNISFEMREPADVIPVLRGVGALLITGCEVLVFRSEAAQAPLKRADVVALVEGGGGTQSPGM